MDFFAVFSFFSENVPLTKEQRLLELICVSVLAALLMLSTAVLLYKKIKRFRAEKNAETERTHDSC